MGVLLDRAFPALCVEAETECANPDLSRVQVNQSLYIAMQASGMARCFRVNDGDEMVGFALLLITPSAHNSKLYATVESLFVRKASRSAESWRQIKAAIKQAAREAGCEAIAYSAHVGTRLAQLLFLESDEFKLTNHIFMQRVSD